jgi:uncharacterized protein involved in response to NO
MPLPSLYKSETPARAWNVMHAAGCGAMIGAVAAVLKALGLFHAGGRGFADSLIEIGVVALAFALLCATAAALRNFIAERLIWNDEN